MFGHQTCYIASTADCNWFVSIVDSVPQDMPILTRAKANVGRQAQLPLRIAGKRYVQGFGRAGGKVGLHVAQTWIVVRVDG